MDLVLVPLKSMKVFPLDFCGGSTIKPFVLSYTPVQAGG